LIERKKGRVALKTLMLEERGCEDAEEEETWEEKGRRKGGDTFF